MEFRIEMRGWLEQEVPDPVEAASLAEVAIFADDVCLTEVEDTFTRTTRQTIRVSGSALAVWLLENFWRLRFENRRDLLLKPSLDWQMAHCLPAIGEGYLWPHLTFFGADGEFSAIAMERTPPLLRPNSVRYLCEFHGQVTNKSLEDSIFSFSETVKGRLADVGIFDSPIHALWQDVTKERFNTKAANFRKLESLLGLDPDSDEKLIEILLKTWSKKLGATAIEEIAAAASSDKIQAILRETETAARELSKHGRRSSINDLRALAATAGEGLPTWMRAQQTAYKVREIWNMGDRPVGRHQLSESLGVTENELSESNSTLPFSFLATDRTGERFGFALARERKESRRFDTARLLGDQLFVESAEPVNPATAGTTVRQRFQRAFAAEFLCPSYVVRERCKSAKSSDELERQLDALASEYEVNDRLVGHHWQNHGDGVRSDFVLNRDVIYREG